MALRDPRNKSRNNASRRTTSATRSTRSKSSAKYNPKPSSAAQRSGKKGSAASKVTTGKGGKISSPRLKQALDSVKTKRTPAKTPPKAKPQPKVKTNPASSTPRGAQGPRQAPQQGPYRKPPSAMKSATPKPKPKAPPKAATPKVSRVGQQIRQAKAVKAANPGRGARAARKLARKGTAAKVVRAAVKNPGLAIAAADIATRRVTDGTLKGKPNVPKGKQKTQPTANNYGNYNTMDPDGRIRSRKRVGPKIVGPKIVGPKIVGPKKKKKK